MMKHIELKTEMIYIYCNAAGEEWKTDKPIEDLTGVVLIRKYTNYSAIEVEG
jgi:hypothetical protein